MELQPLVVKGKWRAVALMEIRRVAEERKERERETGKNWVNVSERVVRFSLMEGLSLLDDGSVRSSERTVTETSPMPTGNNLSSAQHFVSLKLTSRNYLFWRTQMLPFLEGQGLLGFINGSIPYLVTAPVAAADAVASTADSLAAAGDLVARQVAWRRQDRAILSLLISSLSEETMRFAVGRYTSRQLWLTIEQSLASSSRSRALLLFGELQALRQGDSSIADYIGRAQLLIDDLALAGCDVTLDNQNLYVFRGLRSEFRPLAATLARGVAVPLAEVADFLVSQEWICADEGVGGVPPVAMAAGRGGAAPSHGGRGNVTQQ
ncbi:PREDICTED: uncharacterized protein LOC109169393 [Ipomoea nil]|uniref:uncharacterized protein LOC109169393 n=1 Tax=Ipomoea nil TaxID=35883 RepID=UPI0009011EF1|nr:PREDICTED: uncharacterized protein LOC109169393 [Ipomoea nil]